MPCRLVAFVLSLFLLYAGWLPHALAHPAADAVATSAERACPAADAPADEAAGALADATMDGSVSLADAVEPAVLPTLHVFGACGLSMPRADGRGMADVRSTRADGLLRPPSRSAFHA